MERVPRSGAPPPSTTEASGPAHRDAAEILARAAADEAAADAARERYRVEPMAALEPDEAVRPWLEEGERLLTVRRSALLDRRGVSRAPSRGSVSVADAAPVSATADRQPVGLGGDLYLTSRRILLIGRLSLSFELDSVEQVVLASERLLVVLQGGTGVSLAVAQPRLLRVEIAAARAAVRA